MADAPRRPRLTQLGEILAGGIAGALSRCLVAPFDVLKIRMQLERGQRVGGTLAKTGMTHLAYKTIVTEGVTGLWRGNAPAMALWVLYAGVQFPVHSSAKRYLGELGTTPTGTAAWLLQPPVALILSGAIAGVAATCASYPLDWARTRMAAQRSPREHASTWRLLQHTLRTAVRGGARRGRRPLPADQSYTPTPRPRPTPTTQGLAGVFQGLTPTLLQVAPAMAVTVGLRGGGAVAWLRCCLRPLGACTVAPPCSSPTSRPPHPLPPLPSAVLCVRRMRAGV
jgi:hypothetical protein